MNVREPGELIYVGEGTRAEMARLQAVLLASGVRAHLLDVRECSPHAREDYVEIAVASEDHPAAVERIFSHWANG